MSAGSDGRDAEMKQQFAWAIVTGAGKLAWFKGQCPIYWLRKVAQAECNRQTRTSKVCGGGECHVEKVSVLPVFR